MFRKQSGGLGPGMLEPLVVLVPAASLTAGMFSVGYFGVLLNCKPLHLETV